MAATAERSDSVEYMRVRRESPPQVDRDYPGQLVILSLKSPDFSLNSGEFSYGIGN